MAGERYSVRPVTGMGLGAGGFVVVDHVAGHESLPLLWRDEAERIVESLNSAHQLHVDLDMEGLTTFVKR